MSIVVCNASKGDDPIRRLSATPIPVGDQGKGKDGTSPSHLTPDRPIGKDAEKPS